MTFKNKHSFISGFLGAALLIASGCALGGCTEIADEPQGIDDAGNGTPLTIRATASGFVSCVQGDTPATRTPTENGYTTEFNDGDAIGIFALKEYATPDVTPVDGVYNLKLVYTKAADGSGSWAPASGDTHVLYSYDDLVYVAYYPYREGITIKQDIETEIFKDLAANAKLQPAADQSTPAAYTGSDLMAAFARPATDPTDANKKVLTLAFEHLHALLVLKTNKLFNCTPPAGAGFEYSDPMLGADATAKDAVINGIKALPMGDGTFRAIVKTASADIVPTGNYKTTGDKTVLYTGASLAAATFTAGKYYTQQVNMLESPDESVIRPLQEGDFFCSNGKISPYEANSFSSPVIGVVFYVGRHPEDNGVYVDKNGNPMEVHGYVINRSEGTDQWHNGGGTDFGTYKSTTDFNGYFNTDKLQAISAGYNDMMTYVRKQTNSPQTTSGWFLPSIGQLIYIKKKYAEVISKSFDKCGGAMGRGWQHHYWSSTEATAANSYNINWDSGTYSQKNKSSGSMVRTTLVF
jgi:hypothetical protein